MEPLSLEAEGFVCLLSVVHSSFWCRAWRWLVLRTRSLHKQWIGWFLSYLDPISNDISLAWVPVLWGLWELWFARSSTLGEEQVLEMKGWDRHVVSAEWLPKGKSYWRELGSLGIVCTWLPMTHF